jgi:hypothetical protein
MQLGTRPRTAPFIFLDQMVREIFERIPGPGTDLGPQHFATQ